MSGADGQEVLVVDGDEKVQKGLGQLLSAQGLVPTVLADPHRARELVREKYFAAALIDLDTPTPNAGLELVRHMKATAPATALLVMVSRKVFEAAVEAFRAGALDVVVKSPDQVEYLKQRVLETCVDVRVRGDEDRLIGEVLAVHEDFLKRLMETSRHAAELEERLGGGAQNADADGDTSVLVVEPPEDTWLGEELGLALAERGGYSLRTAGSGGEGLDVASAGRFQLALVCSSLPDLPGSMVVSALKAQSADTITILYTRPGTDQPGKAEVIEGSKAIAFVPEFRDAAQMVERLDELREAFRAKSRERRYLAAFRQQNYELLKRYAELKQKLARSGK
jgi:DNA-binding NtrC family response regulator